MAKEQQTGMRGLAGLVGGGGGSKRFDPERFQGQLEEMGYGIAQAQAMAMAIGNILGGNKSQDGGGGISLKDITGAMKDLNEMAGGGNGKPSGKADTTALEVIKLLKEIGAVGGEHGEPKEVGLAKVGVEREANQGNLALALLEHMNGNSGKGNPVLETISALKELGVLGQGQQQNGNSTLEVIKVLKELGLVGGNSKGGNDIDTVFGLVDKLKGTGLLGSQGLSFDQQVALKQIDVSLAKILGEQRLQEQTIQYEQSQHDNGTKAISDVIGFLREQNAQGNGPPGPEADGEAVKIHCSDCNSDFIAPRNQLSDVVTCSNCGTQWKVKH